MADEGTTDGWRAQLPDDLKENEAFTGFEKIGDFANAYLKKGKTQSDLEGKLTNSIQLLKDDASDEDRATFFSKIGRPDKPEGYEFKKPDLPEGITYDENQRCNYEYIIVEVDEAKAGISRDNLVQVLHTENILVRRYFYPGCHEMEPYRSFFPHTRLQLPETERLTQRVMSLPTGTAMDDEKIQTVCKIINLTIENRVEIRKLLDADRELKSV